MTDHYGPFDHPVLRNLPETPPCDFLSEMDNVADEIRQSPKHSIGDDEIAFRQLQQLRKGELSVQDSSDLFELWKDHYSARQAAKLAALWQERDALFEQRASLPEHERVAIDARLKEVGTEMAALITPTDMIGLVSVNGEGGAKFTIE